MVGTVGSRGSIPLPTTNQLNINVMKITYDDTRDIAIRCIDKMISDGLLKENEDNFEIQDMIQDEINEVLGLDIDENFEIELVTNKNK
jgi:hypothetical protein